MNIPKIKSSRAVLIIPCVVFLIAFLNFGTVMAEGRTLFYQKRCSHCHGIDGKGYPGSSVIPKLAGLEAEYIVRQLKAFKNKKRTSERSFVMWGIAAQLIENQMKQIGEFLSRVK